MLYFCATPIGNLGDLTLRALQCMQEADLIAAESVQHSRKLLHYYGINVPLISFRESNRERKGKEIVDRVKKGARVVLITDAGMPAISDPGFSLVRLLLAEKIPFTVLPGPSAALTALVHSGYSTRRFVFWGFLSRKKKERAAELQVLAQEPKTVVLYEAPHRLLKTLQALAAVLGEREIAVCRELTKKFEEVQRGDAAALYASFSRAAPRGEFTLVLAPLAGGARVPAGAGGKKEGAGGENSAAGDNGAAGAAGEIDEASKKIAARQRADGQEKLAAALQAGEVPTAAVKKVARSTGLSRQEVYALLVELKQGKNRA